MSVVAICLLFLYWFAVVDVSLFVACCLLSGVCCVLLVIDRCVLFRLLCMIWFDGVCLLLVAGSLCVLFVYVRCLLSVVC